VTRRFVSVVLALVMAAIALVVWWASAHTVTTDAGVAGDSAARSDSAEYERAELEASEREASDSRTVAATALPQFPRSVAANELASEVARPIGQIRVRLVDAQQRPLHGLTGILRVGRDPLASVTIGRDGKATASTRAPGAPAVEQVGDVPIPANGEFVFESLAFGKWTVVCQAEGCRRAKADVILFDRGPQQELELVLARQRTLGIALRTPGGESFVAALNRTHPQYVGLLRPHVGEHAEGWQSGFVAFTTEKLPSDDEGYWRTVRADSHEPLIVTAFVGNTLLAREDAPLGMDEITLVASVATLEAALGSLAVRVLDDATGFPIAGASVTCNASGFTPPAQLTDADGHVEFVALIGLKASVSVEHAEHVTVAQDAAITAGERSEFVVRLQRGVTIAGVLHLEDGSEGSDLAYLAAFADGASRGTFVGQSTRKPGPTFTFGNLPRGQYVVYTLAATRAAGVRVSNGLELPEPADVASRKGTLPRGAVYVDARRGGVSNVVLVVPAEGRK
jgi:hypothetical protein